MLEFSYKCPVTFEGKMCFLGQTGGQGLCLTYIGVTSDFHVLASDRWQHTGKITFGPTDIRVGGIIYLGAGQQTLLCLNSETVVFHLFCLHGSYACVSDFDFYKHGSSKGWVIKKAKKKNACGFTEQVWAVPSNSDILLLPLHYFVSGFCINEWQEKWQGGMDKCCKMEQKSLY